PLTSTSPLSLHDALPIFLLDDDRVDCANFAREVVDAVEQRKNRLLVRRGDVAAAQTQSGDAAYRCFELLRRHRKEHIASRNAVVDRKSTRLNSSHRTISY